MPIFTVIVKETTTGRTKEVTVDTEGMVAKLVDDEKDEYTQQQQGLPASATITANPVVASATALIGESITSPAAGHVVVAKPDTVDVTRVENIHLGIPGSGGRGGKRSVPSFRLKKRRVTRKLGKTR